MNKKYLAVSPQFDFDRRFDDVFRKLHDLSVYRQAVAGRCFDNGKVSHSQQGHVQCTRDRGSRECQNVHFFPKVLELFLVRDAESLFLVNHDQAELGK